MGERVRSRVSMRTKGCLRDGMGWMEGKLVVAVRVRGECRVDRRKGEGSSSELLGVWVKMRAS
jgi:hypothetical protein